MSLNILTWDTAPDTKEAWLAEAIKRMPDVHANRQKEWALARTALAQCFAEHQIKLEPSNAIFKDHHTITSLPAWRFSLSHTKDVAAAWLMPANEVRNIGLDIEKRDRKVPPQVKARLSNKLDAKLSDLQLWGLKEACYKALPTLAQNDIWLNRIIIANGAFQLEDSPFNGSWQFREENGLCIAQAILL